MREQSKKGLQLQNEIIMLCCTIQQKYVIRRLFFLHDLISLIYRRN